MKIKITVVNYVMMMMTGLLLCITRTKYIKRKGNKTRAFISYLRQSYELKS